MKELINGSIKSEEIRMRHVWGREEWKDIRLDEARSALLSRSRVSPKLGDLTVRDLCCLAREPWIPVGIYVFTEDERVIYTGKTHGRSFHERMLSHVDHRDPIIGSPHLAQLVQSLVKRGGAETSDKAVNRILNMQITWLPVPSHQLDKDGHKLLIAHIERRLLWSQCLDPEFNSPRVKRNDAFSLKGVRYHLTGESLLGDPVEALK